MVERGIDETKRKCVVRDRERDREKAGKRKRILGKTACSRGKRKTSQGSEGMWSEGIIRKSMKKSTFPLDMSGKLYKVCQRSIL